MSKMTATDLAALDKQVGENERELEAAQNRYRSRPRHGISLGQGPVQIDRGARVHLLDLGLDVDRAAIRMEESKKARAEAQLAELENADEIATEAAAEEAARRDLEDVEARLADARTVWQIARGVQKHRSERIKTQRAEIARASAAIRSAEKIAEREQTERSALVPA